MQSWEGKRLISVVTACMTRNGLAELVLNDAFVTEEEYANGVHLDLVEGNLELGGYEEPYVHFAGEEAPAFLLDGVRNVSTNNPILLEDVDAHHRNRCVATG
jgi:hypothetical protein